MGGSIPDNYKGGSVPVNYESGPVPVNYVGGSAPFCGLHMTLYKVKMILIAVTLSIMSLYV